MTNAYTLLAAAETLPLENQPSVLFPPLYDIVWSLIPILIVLWLFGKYVIPRYMETLNEREDKISGELERAAAERDQANALREEYNQKLTEARTEAAEIREEARNKGKQIEAEARAAAEEESRRIVAAGEKQLEASRESVITELRTEIGQNSITLAEKLLGTELSENTKRASTIDSFLTDLDNLGASAKAGK
ncbi:F0F1 ATP synthase subunit B [Corynebacterium guangdongense]|uniref:ATP synthase subunit b n=1 Tax=Corynebacterium guangdongense TaxID=1783348 RepID=A0ABU1ZW26_9CORY|nr:F0F1 ATP synthase subunit B [Corynebacterium guangdongense]MDR7329116.1 F-type H+-transporting ATPase subunit b [Corynebacterium guangdongense]WJZ17685.1 ATP synthase subunit b [Corynebacterium guangdongense]